MEIKKFKTIESGERIDIFLSRETGFTRSHIKKLADEEFLTCNGVKCKANKVLKSGDEIELVLPDNKPLEVKPVALPLEIIYQDDDLCVINKPQGLTVHAGSGTGEETLVNALLYHLDSLSGINGVIRPGIVHRLDKNTSGLLVVAKNDKAHLSLSKQIEDKTCARVYIALLEGVLKEDKGRIETFIGRSDKDRKKMAVKSQGRKAVTNFEVINRYDGYTLCKFKLETGRTHQIRVHAKHILHPVVGDDVYGYAKQKFKLNGQLLHATELSFNHPTTNERMTFFAPIPDYFQEIINKLEKSAK